MGVLNVTPDSFSDGGAFVTLESAVNRARAMVDEGADLIDVGGESTRPGAAPVPVDEELRRVIPTIEALAAQGVSISIDTMKPRVAAEAIGAGAVVLNDVSALRDEAMLEALARSPVTVCLMHMQGDPQTMQDAPSYNDVVTEVRDELKAMAKRAIAGGVSTDRIWLDPGIGFGKTMEHNVALVKDVEELVNVGYPVLLGLSRKSFLGKLLGSGKAVDVMDRLPAALALQAYAQTKGVRVFRTHDVAQTRLAVEAIRSLSA